MKATRTCFLIALVGWVGLSGCSENPALRARYQAEKMFFRAERVARGARVRPGLVTPELSRQLGRQYGDALEFCYTALDSVPASVWPVEHRQLSDIAFRAAIRLSQLAFSEERFDSSVAVLSRLMARVPLAGAPNVSVHLNLGRALQAAGKWDSALSMYDYAVDHFYPPMNDQGDILVGLFNLPNQIYDGLLKVGDTAAAQAQATGAEAYYRLLIDEYPGTNLAGAGHINLAKLYERLGRFQDAVTELSRLTDTTGRIATPAQLRIASLRATELSQPDLAIEEYDRILERLTGRDTLQRPMVMYNKGLVQMHQREYDRARQTMIEIKRRYPGFFNQTPNVQYAIARTYEVEGDQDRAETEYKYLINGFPGSEPSLATYLYLIQQYTRQGRQVEAARYEGFAETEYDRIAATQPGTRAAAAAMSYKAELYRQRGNWNQATALLTQVFDQYPTSEIGFRAAIVAAVIYRDELFNEPAADSLIDELKRRLTTVDETTDF